MSASGSRGDVVAIALALACALSYGSADFLGGIASRRTPALAVTVVAQSAGFVVLLAAMPLLGGAPTRADLLWGIGCGIGGAGAIALLYRGLAVGTMGVVSPITAVLAAALPVGFAILRGERPGALALGGIVCALVAVVLVSRAPGAADAPLARVPHARRFPPGIPEALGAGLAFGLFFIGLAQTHDAARLWPLAAARVASLALLLLGALLLGTPPRVPRPALATVAACGALDMLANVLYVLAAHAGPLAVVAVVSSLYPAATVALAALTLGERLGRAQWTGVAVAFAGIAAISLR